MRYLLAALLATWALDAASAGLRVGDLEAYDYATSANCGLFVTNGKGALTFFADTHYAAFLSVNGKVVELAHQKTENHQHGTGGVATGDAYTTTFSATGVQAVLAMKVVQGCEKTGDKCEEVQEQGTLTVSDATGKAVLAVRGVEHCTLDDD